MKNLACSIHLYNLVAFLAVVVAIVVLSLKGEGTDLAIMTGLVGVLGSFKPWGMQAPAETQDVRVTNPPEDPANVEVQS